MSEAFHEIEGMGDLIQISLDELTDPENESKYFLTKKTLNILSTIEANNLRNVDILSSYRRLVGNLITGDYEKDTELYRPDGATLPPRSAHLCLHSTIF